MGSKRTRNLLRLAAVASYLAACATPAICVEPYNNIASVPGWFTLMLGWLLVFGFQFAWLANPLALVALLVSDRRFGFLPLLLSLGALLLAQQTWMLIGHRLALGDDGHDFLFTSPGIGFYLWLLSFVLIAAASRFGPPGDAAPPSL